MNSTRYAKIKTGSDRICVKGYLFFRAIRTMRRKRKKRPAERVRGSGGTRAVAEYPSRVFRRRRSRNKVSLEVEMFFASCAENATAVKLDDRTGASPCTMGMGYRWVISERVSREPAEPTDTIHEAIARGRCRCTLSVKQTATFDGPTSVLWIQINS